MIAIASLQGCHSSTHRSLNQRYDCFLPAMKLSHEVSSWSAGRLTHWIAYNTKWVFLLRPLQWSLMIGEWYLLGRCYVPESCSVRCKKTSNKRPHENEYRDRWGNLPGLGSHPRYAAPRQPMEHRFNFISTHFHHNSFWELVAEVSNSSGLH